MVFDGSKESCPDDTKSWDSYQENLPTDNKLKRKYDKKCFGICEEGKYIKMGKCTDCESSDYKENSDNYDECKRQNRNKVCPNDGYNKNNRCIKKKEPVWFQKQKEGNMKRESVMNLNLNSEMWYEAQRPMEDLEIIRYLGTRVGNMDKNSNVFKENDYRLHPKYMKDDKININKLRRDINKGRGDNINCKNNKVKRAWTDLNRKDIKKCWDSDEKSYVNKNGVFGPQHIIPEELEDFYMEEYLPLIEESDSSVSATTVFGNLLSDLQYDSAFEDCVNEKLHTIDDSDKDHKTQERIASYTSIKDFQNEDIHYLKRKLRKIINMKTRDVTECMNLLNLGKSICATGVADKTLMIGSLIFKVIGNDRIDIMQADNDERYKINQLIDELGPLIPKAVKNIIKISKEYETRVCNVPTNTTLLLERLYMDLYDKETRVTFDFTPNFDLNFNELANTTHFWHFIQKITVLVVMSILLFMAANFVTVFLSRTQVITKVNEG